MKLENYLEELTDNNWHTLRELIELERDLLPLDRRQAVSNALECAIGYLDWERANKDEGKQGLFEYVTRRLF